MIIWHKVERQPVIPCTITDYVVVQPHPEFHPRIWSITSAVQGPQQWRHVRLAEGIPEHIAKAVTPHVIEYWREICPHWVNGVTLGLEKWDDGWYWRVETPSET